MVWNGGNIKKVGIDETKRILQQAFITSASSGVATTQVLENELSRLGYELSFFGESCDVIHLYSMFGYKVNRNQNTICSEKNPVALADMAEKLHQIFLESKGGDGKSLLTNLFERGKETFEEIGFKSPETILNQYRFLNRFANYFGREYSIINEGENIFLELLTETTNKKMIQSIDKTKIEYPDLGILDATLEKLNNHKKEIKRISHKSNQSRQLERKIYALKETFLQQFWDKYSKIRQPVKLLEIKLEEQDRKLLTTHIGDIQFLTFDKKKEEIQPHNSFISNMFYRIFKEKDPLLIPAPVIGEKHYGTNKDQNLKTYFGFQCQQKTFLQIFDDIFMQRTNDSYMLRLVFEKRVRLLEYFWAGFNKDSNFRELAEIAKHITKKEKKTKALSDLKNEYDGMPHSFLKIEQLRIYLDIEKIKEEISKYIPKDRSIENLDLDTLSKITIDGLSIEEYFGTQTTHLLKIIKINKETRKPQKKQPSQKSIKQNRQDHQIEPKNLTENDIFELNMKIKDFILNNIQNKDVVGHTGYVSLETLKKECFKNDSRITALQDIMDVIEAAKKEGYRYGKKTDDDAKVYIRLSNILFFIIDLEEIWRKKPLQWLSKFISHYKIADHLLEESWDKGDKDGLTNGILSRYIKEYFDCAIYGGYLEYDSESFADAKTIIFNTGLITEKSQDVFLILKRTSTDKLFALKQFVDDVHLPDGFMAKDITHIKFFSVINDAILPTKLVEIGKTDYEHILEEKRFERFPIEIQELYRGRNYDFENRLQQEIKVSLAKCKRDYRFAIPQIYFGETAFLLPIYFNEQKDKSKPAVLCAMTKIKKIKKRNGEESYYYKIRTVLTPQMAYDNARLITKPDSSWLKS